MPGPLRTPLVNTICAPRATVSAEEPAGGMAERDLLTRALGLYMRMAGLAAPLDECLGTMSFWYASTTTTL